MRSRFWVGVRSRYQKLKKKVIFEVNLWYKYITYIKTSHKFFIWGGDLGSKHSIYRESRLKVEYAYSILYIVGTYI